jgi:hypothetical protein
MFRDIRLIPFCNVYVVESQFTKNNKLVNIHVEMCMICNYNSQNRVNFEFPVTLVVLGKYTRRNVYVL